MIREGEKIPEPRSGGAGSLTGRHVSAEELCAVWKRGLGPKRRRQWVGHLGGLCPECLAVLEQCAAREWKSGDHGVGQDDLVLLAVERMLVETNDGPNAELEDVSPWLWLGLRQARRVPLGFCRLIVEESRFLAWSRIGDAVELAEQALSIVKRSELAVHGRKVHQDVIARGHAYLGEAFRLTGTTSKRDGPSLRPSAIDDRAPATGSSKRACASFALPWPVIRTIPAWLADCWRRPGLCCSMSRSSKDDLPPC
jgi:hypothetical protein